MLHPLAHGGEDAHGFFGDGAIGPGTDVEEVIPGVVGASHQVAHDGLGRLPIVVGLLVAPTAVHGHAGFPGARGGADGLLGGGEIAGEAVAVVDNDLGLQLVDHVVHFFGFPLLGVERPVDVVPQNIDLAVIGEEFANVAVDVIDEAAPRGLVGEAAGAIGVVPVHQGIVEAHAETFGAGGFDVLLHQVAAGPLLGGVVVGELGVEVAKPFVVLGGHHHIFLAGQVGQVRPPGRGVGFWREQLGLLVILHNRDDFLVLP